MMLKKILIIASSIVLSGTLSSCSYINKITGGKLAKVSRASYEDVQKINPGPNEKLQGEKDERYYIKREDTSQTHDASKKSIAIVSEDGLRELACTELTYATAADRIQTLGYIPANTPIPQQEVRYSQPSKKAHAYKKAVKKAKKSVAKTDSYNAPVVKSESTTSVDNTTSMDAYKSTLSPEQSTTKPVVIQDNATPEPIATPAPIPTAAPVATPAPIATPVPIATSAPIPTAAPVATPAHVAAPSGAVEAPTPAIMPGVMTDNPTASPMDNDKSPAVSNNTISIGRLATLDYAESSVDIPSSGNVTLDQIVADLKQNPSKNVKIQSYAFSKDGNTTEARRNSLQRAIKVRKYLIDKDVSASRISVNAIEDINNKLNKVEISFEEAKR